MSMYDQAPAGGNGGDAANPPLGLSLSPMTVPECVPSSNRFVHHRPTTTRAHGCSTPAPAPHPRRYGPNDGGNTFGGMQLEGGGLDAPGGDWSAKVKFGDIPKHSGASIGASVGALVSSVWDTCHLLCCGMCEVEKQFREAEERQAKLREGGPGRPAGGKFQRNAEIIVIGLANAKSAQHNGKRGRIMGYGVKFSLTFD